jgi:uncharacterized protein (TIGR03067 family)
MIRAIGLCVMVVALVPHLRADEKTDEWKGLKGTWKVEKAVFMGNDSTEAFGTAVLTMEEGKYVVAFAGQEDKGTIKLDASKNPKQMMIESTEGTNKGKTFPSIYELSGDTLKICYALEGKDPPKAFESKADTQTLFITYKRDKK